MAEPIATGEQCQVHRKTGYRTKTQAQAALDHLNERADYLKTRAVSQGKPAPTVTAPHRLYRDPACHMWHLTSKKR